MNAHLWFSNIEPINTKKISKIDLHKIYEIEKDMWAREDWLGEYVICNTCEEVFSKEKIYKYIDKNIQNQTVTKIEKILWLKNIKCPICWNNTSFLFWEKYIKEIYKRYYDSESYLVIYRDNSWTIRWFMDGYIWNFSEIYKREFAQYYNLIWENNIKKLIENTLEKQIPDRLLYFSSLWTEKNFINFKIITNLIYIFFKQIDTSYNNDILWITEVRKNSNLFYLHKMLWAKEVWINNYCNNKRNSKFSSDIIINPDFLSKYKWSLSWNDKEIIKNLRKYKNSYL